MLQQVKDENGVILLPDPRNVLSTWTPNDQEPYIKGEKLLIHNRTLHFFGSLPEITLLDEDKKGTSNQGGREEEKCDSQFP